MKRREFITLLGGTAAAWPRAARAQQAVPVIGFINSGSPSTSAQSEAAFRRGLADGGFTEGRNVTVEYRWAEGQYHRLPAMAADLVRRQITVILAGGPPAVRAARAATSTIPIVFTSGDDPVKAGFVASLNRPGGNITGVHIFLTELEPKRLGLLREVVPRAELIATLVNPNFPDIENQLQDLRVAAQSLTQRIEVIHAGNESEFDAAFAAMARSRADALLVGTDPFFNSQRDRIVALAARYAIPAVYEQRTFVASGGLMSYGTDLADGYRQAGLYAGRILKGERPGDLPVTQSIKFELVINLKTAKTLGLEVPSSILARADEVIE
jgi:putative tryptophan/tyrosine transport system substrate-binding protein